VTVLAALLVALLALAMSTMLARHRIAGRARRAVASRLTTGADGIIAGAAPIDLPSTGARAALLLHGFGDTPQTLSYLADYIHAHGWAVRAPLLPGHGRTLDEFANSRADEWITFARRELAVLRSRYAAVSIVGLSMGGSLATILAAETPDTRGLVLLAPYLSMPARLQRAAVAHHVLGALFPYLQGGGEQSIRDPAEAARNLAYRFTTPRLVFELSRVVNEARRAASQVTAPTLVIQSRQDHRIPPDAAERAFALFTAVDRRLIWTEGNGHIITVDYGRQAVFELVVEWLASSAGSALPAEPTGGRVPGRSGAV
jgi:carboxylesterase